MAKGLELRLEGNFDQVEAGRQHLACGVAVVPFHALGPGALHAERAAAKPDALEVVDIEDYRHRGGQAEKGIVDGQAVVDPIAIGRSRPSPR